MTFISTSSAEHVMTITLSRPEHGNALNRQLQHDLIATWEAFEEADDLWIAVLHGDGGIFSVGHDVEELANGVGDQSSPIPARGLFPLRLHKPVIAAVEGPCYGLGFELALSCDLRIVGQDARFGFPDQNLYVAYNVGSVLLPRMTNAGLGLELLTTGKVMEPEHLQQLRLVNKVVPSREALASAQEAAASMAHRVKSAWDFQKRQVWQLSGVPVVTAMAMVRGSVS